MSKLQHNTNAFFKLTSTPSAATMFACLIVTILLLLDNHTSLVQSTLTTLDSKSHLVKVTTTIMIENDGNTPITQHFIDCDERNGHSRLSHIVAKMANLPMPVNKTDDGNMWRIDLLARPIEPGEVIPLMVTKVYTHLELVPAHDIYLVPYSSIQYQVRIIKQGRPQKVKIPSEQYYLLVDDKELVDLEESTSTVLALENEGSTKIRFVDKNVIQDEDFIQPESRIHIVNPAYMTMHIKPGDSWALQKYTDYSIEIRIFDMNGNQIYPSDNLDIQVSTGSELVVTNSTSNGTYHTIHTLSSGSSKITARLAGTTPTIYSFDKPYQDIELNQELTIHEALTIKPTAVVLPWLPSLQPTYQFSIYAAGATGAYRWTTNNSELVDINYGDDDSSVAKISTSGQGISFIQVADRKSTVFTRHAVVLVSKIVELDVLPSITETVLGGDILITLAVYANKTSLIDRYLGDHVQNSGLVLFHDCSKIKFDVEIVEKTRFSYDPDDYQPNARSDACISLKFTCNQPGSSRIWISYHDPSDIGSKPIKTTTILSCYKQLKPVYPTEVGVSALHTSIEIAFEGGPRPFGSKLDDHYSLLESSNNQILSFEPIIDRYRFNKDLHVFRAHCNQYGEVDLTLTVGNKPSPTLTNPASSTTNLKLICARPDSIQIRPKLKDSCPLNEMASLADATVPISTKLPTDFEVVVFDDLKRQFLNISSFSIKWSLVGQATSVSKMLEDVNAVSGFRKMSRNYVTVQPSGAEGTARLQAHLNQYKTHSYNDQTLDLTTVLDIQFVDSAQINPNRTIIYNHEKNVVILSILKGSGYFSVESLQGAKNANVTYVSVLGQHRINITPLSVGRFAVRLEDRCIDSNYGAPILSEVAIVDDTDFNREATRPGRTMRYCRDIDSSAFCLYLSVEKLHYVATPTSTQAPHPTIQVPTERPTVAAKIESLKEHSAPSATKSQNSAFNPSDTTTTTATPKVTFDSSPISSQPVQESQSGTIFRSILGCVLALIVTAAAVTLASKWWQDKSKAAATSMSVTSPSHESSFIRSTPSHRSGGVRFSPGPTPTHPAASTSQVVGPQSSTPRQLYTERFSSSLFSD